MDLEIIKKQAIEEVRQEEYRAAVEQYKKQLREYRSLWDRIFPYKIIFIRKENPWR
jgi:hypothetical protein